MVRATTTHAPEDRPFKGASKSRTQNGSEQPAPTGQSISQARSPNSLESSSPDSVTAEKPANKKARGSPAPDSFIHVLAKRAESDPELKAVMKTVAVGEASIEELAFFQEHMNAAITPSHSGSPESRKRELQDPADDQEPGRKKAKVSPTTIMTSQSDDSPAAAIFPSPPDQPATDHDREKWQGFCDIESDPAYFSVILREMGVKGVAVREIFAMHQDLLAMLPQPIYGLILLFRYREFGNADQPTTCPPNVWFANQLPAQNSCGTLAMTNILMNSTEVHVGEHLDQFKNFTNDLTPFQRGEAFASFDHVKKIHNSFAKKMDLLENDKHLAHKVSRAKHAQELGVKPKNKTTKRRSRKETPESVATDDSAESHEDASHHFIAFVPVGNEVWKLDGYDKQPTSMGGFDTAIGETWLSNVTETIAQLMAAGDDEYGVLALTQSPLLSLRKQFSLATTTLQHVEARLNEVDKEWKSFLVDDDVPTIDATVGEEDSLPPQPVPDSLNQKLNTELLPDLLDRRSRLIGQLNKVAADIVVEIQEEAEQTQRAAQRRYDCGPVIKKWLEMLAQNGHLEKNLDRFMPATTRKAVAR